MSKKRFFTGTITANKQKCENCDNKDKCTHNDQIITAFIGSFIKTRIREKLCIIVLNNPIMFEKMLKIKDNSLGD